jgi:hypothetical protein
VVISEEVVRSNVLPTIVPRQQDSTRKRRPPREKSA